ncbi:peptidylprolyl isomerase SurA [Vibrio viridaestus]|uniref:Chaperone SurA n=1 Tax=Vibrio viridaestus TaxID=2487322 RepID=A0A3N9TF34_9VIBR|nr:peptidylprolyl isomerase SurA [Vibrio viridaestus]RQW62848.1 peptidylprolyl isomerase SurA [Vibrio viridaestus]
MNRWKYALTSFMLLLSFAAQSNPVELDKVVVIVNDGAVLQSDITTATKLLKASAAEKGNQLPPANVIREQVIDQLINDKLQEQEADRIGVKIDDTKLNQALSEIAEHNKQSLQQLKTSIEQSGVSYAEFRDKIRQELAATEARNVLVRRRINILPNEVESLAGLMAQKTSQTVEYKISHIQLKVDDSNKDKMKSVADNIVKKLKNGADFTTLALTYSKGPKALKGGNWGWMRKEEMPTIFADHISIQKKGDIIGPFQSGVGYHILKIDDVKGLESVSVTEVDARHILIKPSIILSDEGAEKELKEFVQRIKSGKAKFGDLAEQYSQDPGSASHKGDLGYQTPDSFVPEFKHQVETLPVGQISEPFKTVHGWHIVQVLSRRQVDRTDAAMKNKAYRIIFNRKFNEESSAWLQELRASAYIENLDEEQ